jgi:hypothetical protein
MKSSSTTRKQYSDHAVFCLDEVGVEERKLYSTKFYDRKISFDVIAKRYIQIYLFIVHKYMMYMPPENLNSFTKSGVNSGAPEG